MRGIEVVDMKSKDEHQYIIAAMTYEQFNKRYDVGLLETLYMGIMTTKRISQELHDDGIGLKIDMTVFRGIMGGKLL